MEIKTIENEIQFELTKAMEELYLDAAKKGFSGEMYCNFSLEDGLNMNSSGSGGVMTLNITVLLAYTFLLLADGLNEDPIDELKIITNQAYKMIQFNTEEVG